MLNFLRFNKKCLILSTICCLFLGYFVLSQSWNFSLKLLFKSADKINKSLWKTNRLPFFNNETKFVFFDLGVNNGDSLLKFLKLKKEG